MTIGAIAKVLDADVLTGRNALNREVTMICGCDLMSDVLAFVQRGTLLLTGLTNAQVVRTAEVSEISGICLVRGKTPPPETLRLAEEKGIPLLATKCSMFEACGRLYQAGIRH